MTWMNSHYRSLLAVSLLVLLSFQFVHSVDRHKFKKCDQSSFCKRNRALSDLSPSDLPLYNVSYSSIKKIGNSHISAAINSPYTSKSLTLDIYTIEENVVRFKVSEDDKRRYQGPQDLLSPLKEHSFNEVSKSETMYVFSTGSTFRGELHLSPFKLVFYQNDEPVITANSRNLFNFEHLRTKEEDDIPSTIADPNASKPDTWQDDTDGVWEAPTISNPQSAGRWEEQFDVHKDTKPRGPTAVSMDFTFHDTEHVYGIPEHADSLALKTTKGKSDPYRLYNLDVFEYELNNEMALYGSIPFMASHSAKRTVGMLWFNAAETWIDISHESTGVLSLGKKHVDTHWISEAGNIDVFFFLGPKPYDVFGRYAEVSGHAPIPPLFSIAYHQCKWNYKDQREVAEIDFGFDTHNIPMDVVWLDIEHTDGKAYFTWDKNNFATPKDMQNGLAIKGRQMVTIVDPHIKRDGNYYVHRDAQAAGDLYIKNRDNNDYEGHCWPGSSSWIDYTSPKARTWWSEKFAYDVYAESTPHLYTWNDMNEPSVFNGPEVTMHKDAIHFGGVEHREVHNAYGLYMHMATSEGLVARNKGRNERPFVLSRAFFAGTQKIGAIWTGDNKASWDHLEIAQPMLLSLGIAGLSFVGADVGGFFGNPEPELLTRWYQAGAFYPFFRAHAHLDSKRREPWLMGEQYLPSIAEAIRVRYSFLPFWYTQYHNNSISGIPIMRPLWVEYPTDSKTFAEQDEFLVGRDLLVKPVTAAGVRSASVYLPGDQPWYDYVANKKYTAPQIVNVDTPLNKIPVFQRGGSIIPKKERVRRSSALMINDPYTLVVALDNKNEAEGELYVDDGHSYNHQNGEYIWRKFEFKANQLTSTQISTGTYDIANTVERIVIYGLPKTNKITLNGKELSFTVEGDRTTIRKPDVRIIDNWTINFQ